MSIINNKFKFIWVYISLLIAFFQYGISQYISWFSTLIWGLLLFIPVICTYLICFLTMKLSIKHPKISKFLSNIFNFILVIIIQLIIIGIISAILSTFIWIKNDNMRLYKRAITMQEHQERIIHFPNKIPGDKKNTFFHIEIHPVFGSREILLSFFTTNEYIQQEIKKYKYKIIEGPYNTLSQYNLSNYTYSSAKDEKYIIEKKNYIIDCRNNYAYGILVDEKHNKITYYYFVRD